MISDISVLERELEIALYKTATETVKEELFALSCENDVKFDKLDKLSSVAMERCHGKVSIYGTDVYCDGRSFKVGKQCLFSREGLMVGWYSWLTRGFASWTSWEGLKPVIIVVCEDLRFAPRLVWDGSHSVRVISVNDRRMATAVVDGEMMIVPLVDLLGFIAVQGLSTR